FYAEPALREQMSQGHEFFIAELNSEPVGFSSFGHGHTVGTYKIHKLYVHPMVQGKGVGKKLIAWIIGEIRNNDAVAVRLNVNRHNPARFFYEKSGFMVTGEEDIAIGEGYFMSDYVMEKKL
nr:GNAT family N-acetyltransferase [Chitinophagaceae bacterium]